MSLAAEDVCVEGKHGVDMLILRLLPFPNFCSLVMLKCIEVAITIRISRLFGESLYF